MIFAIGFLFLSIFNIILIGGLLYRLNNTSYTNRKRRFEYKMKTKHRIEKLLSNRKLNSSQQQNQHQSNIVSNPYKTNHDLPV